MKDCFDWLFCMYVCGCMCLCRCAHAPKCFSMQPLQSNNVSLDFWTRAVYWVFVLWCWDNWHFLLWWRFLSLLSVSLWESEGDVLHCHSLFVALQIPLFTPNTEGTVLFISIVEFIKFLPSAVVPKNKQFILIILC